MTAKGAPRSVPQMTARLKERVSEGPACGLALAEIVHALAVRVQGEYQEMPGLHLTVLQAARLFGVAPEVAHAVLDDLYRASVLTRSERGMYSLSR